MQGKKHSASSIRKMQKAAQQRWKDKDYKTRWVAAVRKRWKDPRFAARRRRELKDPVRCSRISAAHVGKVMPRSAIAKMRATKLLPANRRAASERAKKQWLSPGMQQRMHAKGWNTKLEQLVSAVLSQLGIKFKQQPDIPGVSSVPDFLLPSFNRIVECDGAYWHTRPEVQMRDRRSTRRYRKAGYHVSRWSDKFVKRQSFISHVVRLLGL
jgi:very-short-patch-repair endonuclease